MPSSCSHPSPDAARETARSLAVAQLDVYESAARTVSELGWLLARCVAYGPIASSVRAWADATRDATAVQLSTARWVLDL
jgi:hypothetical protein